MNDQQLAELVPIPPPKAGKYLLLAPLLIAMLILGEFILDVPVLFSVSKIKEMTMMKLTWVGIPLVLIGFILSGHYLMSAQKALTRKNQIEQREKLQRTREERANDIQGRREYVLEIIGMGVTLDKYRQGKLWDILQKDTPYTNIREQDPQKYAWGYFDKTGISGGRA